MFFKSKSNDFVLSEAMLAQLIPSNKDVAKWHKAMLEIFPKYDINTKTTLVIQKNLLITYTKTSFVHLRWATLKPGTVGYSVVVA